MAGVRDAHESAWRGRLFLGSGRLLYAGPVGPTTPHAHHAFQILRSATGVLLQGDADPTPVLCRAAIIPSDATHAIAGLAPSAMLLDVDPDSRPGRALRTLSDRAVRSAVGWAAAGRNLESLHELETPRTWDQAEAAADRVLGLLTPEDLRRAPVHPAVKRAVALVAASALELRLSAVAASVRLSEGRLSHAFSAAVGVPFRVYVLWHRLQRAAASLAAGATITDAAHEAGFADGAHLTPTFRRMFGIAPSDVVGVADWIGAPRPTVSTE